MSPVLDVPSSRTEPADAQPTRRAGLDLLQLSSRLDEPVGVRGNADSVDMAVFAFGARGRRLLRAAYLLLDANMPDAANALFRVMTEYNIVGRWLAQAGEQRMRAWAFNDLRERLTTLREVLTEPKLIGEARRMIEDEILRSEEALRGYGGADIALSKRAAQKAGETTPNLQAMADEVGLGLDFLYSYVYRVLSQADSHATMLSIDAVYDVVTGDPGPRLKQMPRHGLPAHDLYGIGARLLADMLGLVAERFPELGWDAELQEIAERLRIEAPEHEVSA